MLLSVALGNLDVEIAVHANLKFNFINLQMINFKGVRGTIIYNCCNTGSVKR